MPGAVLHVAGEAFDPESGLAGLSLTPYEVFRKGERRFPNNPKSEKRYEVSGFKCLVSDADGILSEEVKDAIAFLKRHYDDLSRLAASPAVERMTLDFGHYFRIDGERVVVQCDYLPPELLRLAGELRIGIELSLYPRPSGGRAPRQPDSAVGKLTFLSEDDERLQDFGEYLP